MCFAKCAQFALITTEFYLVFYHLVGEDTESSAFIFGFESLLLPLANATTSLYTSLFLGIC